MGIWISTGSIVRTGAIFSAAFFLVVTLAIAQDRQMEIKYARSPETPVESGEEMYRTYCAVCHGTDAKGGGPATPALKGPVPDLTILSQNHGGKYPAHYVESILRFGAAEGFPAHGNKDMPIWGRVFATMPGSNRRTVNQGITKLTQYLETLQAK